MKTIKRVIYLFILVPLSLLSCEDKGQEPKPECQWEPIAPVEIPEELENSLDIVFGQNFLIHDFLQENNILRKDTLFVIDNKSDFSRFCLDESITEQIDFNTQSIVWGVIYTSSISDRLLEQGLSKCNIYSMYQYTMRIKQCVGSCYAGLGTFFFWGIYQGKINEEEVSLNIILE